MKNRGDINGRGNLGAARLLSCDYYNTNVLCQLHAYPFEHRTPGHAASYNGHQNGEVGLYESVPIAIFYGNRYKYAPRSGHPSYLGTKTGLNFWGMRPLSDRYHQNPRVSGYTAQHIIVYGALTCT